MSHCHHSCKHEKVKFCKDCNEVYCESCKETWKAPCTLNHYGSYPWYTYATRPAITNVPVSVSDSITITNSTDTCGSH